MVHAYLEPIAVAASPAVVTVAVMGSDLVVCGLESMLAAHGDHVRLVDRLPPGPGEAIPDIVVVDIDYPSDDLGLRVEHLLAEQYALKVVALTSRDISHQDEDDLIAGVSGYLHKGLGESDLVAGLLAIQDEQIVPRAGAAVSGRRSLEAAARRRDVDELSERKVEVLNCVASGMSNDEMAAALFLSINTIKSYIRSTYQKIGVSSRSQAVIWAVTHGLSTAFRS